MGAASRSPLVSILLPVFDAAATLAPCLRSLRRQTESRWECVVVDDGSRDGSLGIARAAAAADLRFRVLERAHRGLVPALNSGLERCRGAYVARIDADDLMHRRRLAEQVALLESEPGLAGAGCHVRLFPRAVLRAGLREYERWINSIDGARAVRREAFVECPLVHPSLMLRREPLMELGYRDRGWPEDYDLLLRLLESGRSLGVLPRRRLLWRHGDGRLSRRSAIYAVERFTACKAEFLSRGFLAGGDEYILWGYGGTGRALRKALALHGKRPSHIVELHPGRLGNRIHGAPVVPREELVRLPRLPLVVSVAGAGPRGEIREFLTTAGRVETRDYVCAA